MIEQIKLERFTAFESLTLRFTSGINLFIGENGTGSFEVTRHVASIGKSLNIKLALSNHTKEASKATVSGAFKQWLEHPLESVYIPVKDMMANAPGFRSLYSLRHIHFEEVYADIIDRAVLGCCCMAWRPKRSMPDRRAILRRAFAKLILANTDPPALLTV